MQIYDSASDQPILDWQWLEPGLRNITANILQHVPPGAGGLSTSGAAPGGSPSVWPSAGTRSTRSTSSRGSSTWPSASAAPARRPAASGSPTSATRDEVIPDHYDLIVCSEVLEHVVDYQPIHENIYRSLKPGGRLLISVPCDPKQFSVLDTYGGHVRRFTVAQVEEDLQRYRRRKIIVTGFPSYRTLVAAYLLRLRLTGGQHSNEALWLKPSRGGSPGWSTRSADSTTSSRSPVWEGI